MLLLTTAFRSSILAALKTRDHYNSLAAHPLETPEMYLFGREVLFGITEICMTIIAACIPFLRPLLDKIRYGSKSEMPVVLKAMAGSSQGTSSMGHPHTRLGSSCYSAKHGPQEDDDVEMLATKSGPERIGKTAESNGPVAIVRKTHVSIQYNTREVEEEQCPGHYHANAFGPGQGSVHGSREALSAKRSM